MRCLKFLPAGAGYLACPVRQQALYCRLSPGRPLVLLLQVFGIVPVLFEDALPGKRRKRAAAKIGFQLYPALGQVGVRCVRLEGSMSMEARDRMIDAFTNDPAVTVFLMSLKAGGVALNLTAASHVMLLDPWWCAAAGLMLSSLFITIYA